MDVRVFEMVSAVDATFFELYTAVRTQELGLQGWEPETQRRLLRFQFEAQRRGYRDQFPAADEHLLLCDGTAVGWLIVDRSGPALVGLDIALVQDERSKGIGTSVIRALQDEAAAAGRPMVITVHRPNVRAIALYVRLGFKVIRESDVHTVMEWRQ